MFSSLWNKLFDFENNALNRLGEFSIGTIQDWSYSSDYG